MKQKLITLLLILAMAFSLAGCANELNDFTEVVGILVTTGQDAGIIGGADGPTGVLVTDGENSVTATIPEGETKPETQQQPTGYDEPAAEVPAIDEDGTYNSVEDVSLYLYTYGELPDNYITKNEARDQGWEGGSVERYAGEGYAIGGDRFGNNEGLLPKTSGRQYYECDIDTVGESSRGAERIVYSNDGLIYYTDDHYEHFELLYGPECQDEHLHEEHCYEDAHR